MMSIRIFWGLILSFFFAVTLPGWISAERDKPATMPVSEKPITDYELPSNADLRLHPNTGTIRYLKGKKLLLALNEELPENSSPQNIALDFIEFYKTIFKLEHPRDELRCTTESKDELGLHHIRFQQIYDNIPVWGNELNVHIDQDNSVYLVQGSYIPTPHIPTQPSLSIVSAIEKKLSSIVTIEKDTLPDVVELVIFVNSDQNPILTYKILFPGSIYFVDTVNGNIVEQIATYQSRKSIFTPNRRN